MFSPPLCLLFPHRLVLRLQELRAIMRGGLPGVHRCESVKTRGTKHWQMTGELQRLFMTQLSEEYSAIGLHALNTLLEPTNRWNEGREVTDGRSLPQLAELAPSLTTVQLQNMQDNNTRVIIELQKTILVGRQLCRTTSWGLPLWRQCTRWFGSLRLRWSQHQFWCPEKRSTASPCQHCA